MSLDRLDRAIAQLPARPWTVRDLGELRAAAGERVNAEEQQRFADLLAKRWQSFSEPARRELELLAGHAAPDVEPTRLRVGGRYETGISEQSSLAFVSPEVGFLLIDDETSRVWRVPMPEAGAAKALDAEHIRKNDGRLESLEGLAFDGASRSVLTLDEGSGAVHELALTAGGDGPALGAPKKLGALEEIGDVGNKGWEGLCVLPAELTSDRRARVVAVHEGDPLAIGVFDRRTLRMEAQLPLPVGMDPRDLSDLALDPKTGRFFILSDESRSIWEVELRQTAQLLGAGPLASRWAVLPIHETKLPGDDLKPEGITIDHRGDVWVSFEESSALLHMKRD